MKAFRLALLASAVLLAPTGLALSQECAKEPVTVGFLPKLDTDPYFGVAKGQLWVRDPATGEFMPVTD